MCDSPPGENDDNSIVSGGSTIYSTPVAQLGSTNDLAKVATSPPAANDWQKRSSDQLSDETPSITNLSNNKSKNNMKSSNLSEVQTGNTNAAAEGEVGSKQQIQNSMDMSRSPTSQRKSCSATRSGGSVRTVE